MNYATVPAWYEKTLFYGSVKPGQFFLVPGGEQTVYLKLQNGGGAVNLADGGRRHFLDGYTVSVVVDGVMVNVVTGLGETANPYGELAEKDWLSYEVDDSAYTVVPIGRDTTRKWFKTLHEALFEANDVAEDRIGGTVIAVVRAEKVVTRIAPSTEVRPATRKDFGLWNGLK